MKTVQQSPSGRQLLAGYLAALTAVMCCTLSASCVQALQGAIPDFQLSAIRAAIQGLIYFIGGLIVSTDFRVQNHYAPLLIYSGFVYLCYNVGFFGGATYIPLADLEGVVLISGIAFAVAQSKLLFNIDIKNGVIVAAAVCLVGTVLTVQPSWMFTKMPQSVDNTTACFIDASSIRHPLNTSHGNVLLGYMFGILGGAGHGLMPDVASVLLHEVEIVPKAVYAMLVCTVGSVAFMFYLEDPVYVMDVEQFVLIVGHSLLSALGAFLAIYAASIIAGPSLLVLWSLEVVTMLLSQYTIMHSVKPGNYNWMEVLGCIIVVCGASIPGVINILAHRAKADELP